jgi:5-methylcytosine-specific restriction endonuclease McrA
MDWFRMYGEMVNDPKIGSLTDSEFRSWVELLCLACLEEKDGLTSVTKENINWMFRRDALGTIEALSKRDLVTVTENGQILITKWADRQQSISSKERVARYRERLKVLGKTTDYLKHKQEVCNRYGNKCVYCGSDKNICIDHVIPLIRGGDNEPDNLVTACKQCNSGKSGKLLEETSLSFKNPLAEKYYVTAKERCNGYGNALEKRREEEIREDKKIEDKTSVEQIRPCDVVFEHWRKVMNHPKAALDEKRKALINKNLKLYSVDDLKLAIDGCSKTPFNMGLNDSNTRYDDLSLILRDADHIDRFIRATKGKNGYSPPSTLPPEPKKDLKQDPSVIKAALQKSKDILRGEKNEN